MKLKMIIALTAALLATAGLATAKEGPYASFSAGMALQSDSDFNIEGNDAELSYDPGYALSAAIGADFRDFRIEGEFGYKSVDMDQASAFGMSENVDGTVSNLSFMGNAYLNFWNRSQVTPYLMGGVGISNVEIEVGDSSEDEVTFAFQAGAGLSFAMSDTVSLDLSYRYFNTPALEINDIDVDNANHNVMAAVRFGF